MNNPNEQFVEPSDTANVLEKMLGTKVILTDSYQALVADLQNQNQQLTEKLIAVMEENAKLREQLFTNKGLSKVSLPNLPEPIAEGYIRHDGESLIFPTTPSNEILRGYASPF